MSLATRSSSLWQSFLSNTCFGCTSSESYTLLEEEEAFSAVTEETRYRDSPPAPSSQTPLPPTSTQPMTSIAPPIFLAEPRSPPIVDVSMKRLHKRGLLNTSNFHAEEITMSSTRSARTPKDTAAITETELTDNMNLVDTASMIGSVGSILGTGYAGATYYQQRRADKEAKRREQDLEAAIGRVSDRVEAARTDRSVAMVKEVEQTAIKASESGPVGRADLAWTGMR